VLLTGYPRLSCQGFPLVHDQVFALEARLGAIKGCVVVDADAVVRERCATAVGGKPAPLAVADEEYARQLAPVASFMGRVGKLVAVDASSGVGGAFEQARPFLE
jgi:hypothetical protein